ncbi:NAD-dependent epimerase/dehydratase family protein [Clostridium sp. DSM 100503]|uniref:SDR family NAD(P)-dependent oxidoreductase n=1 Tax=Clostridium sp. DSM 100503 TaxID=2963282 RepID=UPI00214A8670|nr:SDR family NAD(P)-dependent oxidoreductase [Clostridium sp. DSM 100503]MCR1951317.1 NAD-dependent epimerase/dehydratase family protein [Clostridium sp. DSM 100503]
MKKIVLITGACGFIGFHLSKFLIGKDYKVVGIDNLNDYYDVTLKEARLDILKQYENFTFYKIDIKHKKDVDDIFNKYKFDYVINLAGQAGVRHSIIDPYSYIDSNIVGFINILEACRYNEVKHLLYASSSSVYGGNKVVPFSENHNVDHPVSLYAATKKSNELMAHSYSNLYDIPTTGLRFFTVYGPWGRPDMAYFSFTKDIIEGNAIKVFNHGKMERDFTYIDDIVESIYRLLPVIPKKMDGEQEGNGEISSSFAPYKIYNIGNSSPVKLEKFISILEKKLELKAKKNYIEMQDGDVKNTYANTEALDRAINYKSSTSIEDGLSKFIDWYKLFYK